MTLICDTSGLLSAINNREKEHENCVRTLTRHTDLVVSPLALAELDYLATTRINREALTPFYDDVANGVYEVATVENAIITEARQVDDQYGRLGLGLTDAVNIVLAHVYGTNTILSLDAHYRAVKPLSRHSAFNVVPSDVAKT